MRDGENHQSSEYVRRLNRLIQAGNNQTQSALDVKYHSTQINLEDCAEADDTRFDVAVSSLPDEAINEVHPYQTDFVDGRERHPHITVLYGLVNEADFFKLRQICQNMAPFEVEVGTVKAFRNESSPHDVLVYEILSPELKKLNSMFSAFENENTFPEYKPHMTIAYVKKGALADLEGKPFALTGEKYTVSKIHFSHVDGYMLEMPLGG